MMERMSVTKLTKKVMEVLKNDKYKVYDEPPSDAPSPLVYVELVNKREASNKTMFIDVFTFHIHAIADTQIGHVKINEMIDFIEQTLSCDIALEDPFELLRQENSGLIANKIDETGEKHAVLEYNFYVVYGYKIK